MENKTNNLTQKPPLQQTAVVLSSCLHDFVIKFGEYECQNCGISHEEAIKPYWKNCPKCENKGTFDQLVTGDGYCSNCNHKGVF